MSLRLPQMHPRLGMLGRRLLRYARWACQLLGLSVLLLLWLGWWRPATLQPLVLELQQGLIGLVLRSGGTVPQPAASSWQRTPLATLSRSQAAVAQWLGAQYRVDPEAVATLLLEAERLGRIHRLPPHLILAMIAIESNFHPYVESSAGAQGLMQVMPQVHAERYRAYGGSGMAVDPLVNMQVGVAILHDAMQQHGGSLDAGLRFYSGASGTEAAQYVARVRAEQGRLDAVAAGKQVALPGAARGDGQAAP